MERALTAASSPPRVAGHVVAVRVVVSGEDHDLLAPDDVPVVELLHELGRHLGPSGPSVSTSTARLVRADGEPLLPGLSLRAQGVDDGAVLALVPQSDPRQRDAVDDAVEAVEAVGAWRPRPAHGASERRADRPSLLAVLSAVAAGVVVLGGGHDASAVALPAVGAALAVALGGVLVVRRTQDVVTGLTAMAGAGLVGAAAVLHGPAPTSAVLARLGTVLGLLAVAALLALPRRAEVALAPTVAGLMTLAAAAALARLPVTTTQVAAAVLAVAGLGCRAVPWVAVAATGLERATQVAPAGRHRPGSTGGVDLDAVELVVDTARRTVLAATWGLGGVAAVASVVVAGAGHAGLLLTGCLGLLLAAPAVDGEQGLRTAGPVCGAGVLAAGVLSAAGGRGDPAPVLLAPVLLAVVAGAALAVLATGGPDRPGPPAAATQVCRSVVERVTLLAVPPLLACALGLLPTPWGLP